MKVVRHDQSTQNKKFVKLLQCIKEMFAAAFVFYCDAKHSDTLQGSRHACCYLVLGGFGQNWAWRDLFDYGTLKSAISQE